MPTRHLFVLRHGPTDMNAAGVIQGRLDASLTEDGRVMVGAHARFLAERSPHGAHILAGPLARTRQTAEILAAVLGATIEIVPALTEIGRGDLEGLEKACLSPPLDAAYARFLVEPWSFRPPGAGAECFADVEERLRRGAVPRIREILDAPGDASIVVVTHGSVGKILVGLLTGNGRGLVDELPGRHSMIWHLSLHRDLVQFEALDGKRGYAPVDVSKLPPGALDA